MLRDIAFITGLITKQVPVIVFELILRLLVAREILKSVRASVLLTTI